jgi:hypothetical protein
MWYVTSYGIASNSYEISTPRSAHQQWLHLSDIGHKVSYIFKKSRGRTNWLSRPSWKH